MSEVKVKTCDFVMMEMVNAFSLLRPCPHIHTKPIGGTVFLDGSLPENFCPDGDGLGMYTHCLNCGVTAPMRVLN